MKTLNRVPVELVIIPEGECCPDAMDEGKFYYSAEYKGANHLCLCGCKMEICIPIKQGEWSLNNNKGKLTVTPYLAHRNGCKSHYIITNGIANFV